MDKVNVKVVNKSNYDLPQYSDLLSVGMDLRANINEIVVLKPLERKLIPTGLYVDVPVGYSGDVRPRSGLAVKKGITVLNTPGTVDPGYHGEVCVVLINLSNEDFAVNPGDRIAQFVLTKVGHVEWQPVEDVNQFDSENRGGGLGHSGVK